MSRLFASTFQGSYFPVFFSAATKPLNLWSKQVRTGHIKRVLDEEISSPVLEIIASNINTTFMTSPRDPTKTLGISLPVVVLYAKNLGKYFSFEIQVIDDKNIRRRFRASTFNSSTKVRPFVCSIPLKLDDGWNRIQLSLAELTSKAYGTTYVETTRIQVNANCRLRRIYFSDRSRDTDEIPDEFKHLASLHDQPAANSGQPRVQPFLNAGRPSFTK